MTEVLDPPQCLPQVAAARSALVELAGLEAWRLAEVDLLAARRQVEELAAILDSARLELTGEIDARGAAVAAGASSTRAWLAHQCRQHPGAAHAEVRLAEALRERLPATRAAMAAGTCSRPAATIVADTVTEVAEFAPHRVAEAESFLLRQALALGPKPLAVAARRLSHTLDPDQGDRLARDEQRQYDGRGFAVNERRDGSFLLHGELDHESGVLVRTALGPLSRPRPKTPGGALDPRTASQRAADGLVALAQIALASGDLPDTGGQRPHVTLTVPVATLAAPDAAGLLPGELDQGGAVSAETARRIACDSLVTAVFVGEQGQPLALGRATRQPSVALLRALAARDRGCAFPGCDRPVAWCQAHHIRHWSQGGCTDLDNLVLVCGHHHRAVHHTGWTVWVADDGLPTFRPPPWIDPAGPDLRQPRPELLL